jgi:hypothetical protein
MSAEEKTYVAAYLKTQEIAGSEKVKANLARRMKDMDAGQKLSADDVRILHSALDSKRM